MRSDGNANLSFNILFHLVYSSLTHHSYRILIPNRRAAIIGKSMLVGQPCYHLLRRQGFHIDQCDIHTPDIPSITRQADLIVSAVGKPGLITAEWIKPGACIVDIGTRCVKDTFGVCKQFYYLHHSQTL